MTYYQAWNVALRKMSRLVASCSSLWMYFAAPWISLEARIGARSGIFPRGFLIPRFTARSIVQLERDSPCNRDGGVTRDSVTSVVQATNINYRHALNFFYERHKSGKRELALINSQLTFNPLPGWKCRGGEKKETIYYSPNHFRCFVHFNGYAELSRSTIYILNVSHSSTICSPLLRETF